MHQCNVIEWDSRNLTVRNNSLKFVNADKNHVMRLTVVESCVRTISTSWMILLVAPIGVQKGWKTDKWRIHLSNDLERWMAGCLFLRLKSPTRISAEFCIQKRESAGSTLRLWRTFHSIADVCIWARGRWARIPIKWNKDDVLNV